MASQRVQCTPPSRSSRSLQEPLAPPSHLTRTLAPSFATPSTFLSVVQRQVHGPAWHNFDCFIFHDVDLLPEDARNLYTCPSQPRHMSVAVDELNYRYYGNDTFNKGAIMNAAFLSVVQRQVHGPAWHNFDCFIFHDVDLLPEDARNLYT
ncbi:hypothetical protein B566_EDAN018971, partial [Ephemera danica]